MEEPAVKNYQRYIFVQERRGPSVYISTHLEHERMEVRMDQSNMIILLTILKITKTVSL